MIIWNPMLVTKVIYYGSRTVDSEQFKATCEIWKLYVKGRAKI